MELRRKILAVVGAFGGIATLSLFLLGGRAMLQASFARAAVAPTVVSVVMSTTAGGTTDDFSNGNVNLVAGADKTIYLNGIVEDLDGRDEITSVFGVFHRSGVTGGNGCSSDGNACYRNASCSLVNNEDLNQKVFSCRLDLHYYADATASGSAYAAQNWAAYIYVSDGQSYGENSSVTKEIPSLLSISIPTTLPFGARSVGDVSTSGNNQEMTFVQQGNTEADVEVLMANPFQCQTGTIPVDSIKWALTDVGFTHASANVITAQAVDTNVYVGYGNDGTPSPSKALYWNISVPIGVGGNCTSSISVSAIAH